MSFFQFQNLVVVVVYFVFAVVKVWAFVDCLRRPDRAFPAVERQTKLMWLVLTGITALTGLVFDPLSIFGIAGIVVALIYLFEIRPRIMEVTGR